MKTRNLKKVSKNKEKKQIKIVNDMFENFK